MHRFCIFLHGPEKRIAHDKNNQISTELLLGNKLTREAHRLQGPAHKASCFARC